MVALVAAGGPVARTRNGNLERTTTMRKTIIFGAIAALFGLVAAAQASNDHAERAMRNGGQITYMDTDDRGETAEHKMRERAEHGVRERDDDAYEHGRKAREHRERRERHDRD
jgi:hypothetical protein